MMRQLISSLREAISPEKTVPADMLIPPRPYPKGKKPKMQQKRQKTPKMPARAPQKDHGAFAIPLGKMVEYMKSRKFKMPKKLPQPPPTKGKGAYAISVAAMIERMAEISVPGAMQDPPRPYPRGRVPRMQQRKVAKSKMRTPAAPPTRSSAYATSVQMVDGREDSGSVSARAWQNIHHWETDHGKPQMTESIEVDPDVAAVMDGTDMFAYRRMAGLPLLEKKAARPTMPDREQISGAGNKSGMPRSTGTGAGDYDPKDLKKPKYNLKAAQKKADDEEPEDDEEETEEAWTAFQGTFTASDIVALAEEAMPFINAAAAKPTTFSREPEKQEEQMLDLVLSTPAIRP